MSSGFDLAGVARPLVPVRRIVERGNEAVFGVDDGGLDFFAVPPLMCNPCGFLGHCSSCVFGLFCATLKLGIGHWTRCTAYSTEGAAFSQDTRLNSAPLLQF